MTTDLNATAAGRTILSTRNKAGLALAGLMGVADLVGLAAVPQGDAAEPGPPAGVMVFAAVMGVVTLIGVVLAWRTGDRRGSRVVAGSRILSAITALPAFFVADVPAGLVLVAGVGIVLTVVAVWLVLSPPKD